MASNAQVSRVLAGSFHYSTVLTQWQMGAVTFDMLDATTINDTARQFISGQDTSTATAQGFVSPTSSAALGTWKGTPTGLTIAPSGLALGAETYLANANMGNVTFSSPVGGINGFSLATQTDGYTDIGFSLHDLTAESTTAVGTGVDGAAATANGGLAQIHVTAFSGLTNIIVLVEHSVDNSTWNTLATFTTITATGSERILVAAGTTVRRYVRASWTKTGTGSCTFQSSFARR